MPLPEHQHSQHRHHNGYDDDHNDDIDDDDDDNDNDGNDGGPGVIAASDRDRGAVAAAVANCARAGVGHRVSFTVAPLQAHPWLSPAAPTSAAAADAQNDAGGDDAAAAAAGGSGGALGGGGAGGGGPGLPARPARGRIVTNPPFGLRVSGRGGSEQQQQQHQQQQQQQQRGSATRRGSIIRSSIHLLPLYQSLGASARALGGNTGGGGVGGGVSGGWGLSLLAADVRLARRCDVRPRKLATAFTASHGGVAVTALHARAAPPRRPR